ncbi:MAG TPA: flagellar hook protein FlgE [Bryobacteraceae bacterium]|nr:flagellar hook protein FlgE [Bryobacteraceae bacterium]
MGSTFSVALTGLNADKTALDVVGNNLANLNTVGFKDVSTQFADLIAQAIGQGSSQIGEGVSAPMTERQFLQGSIQLTSGAFDAAIQGNGFFVVRNTAGSTLYTRAGNFKLAADGTLLTATGDKVQGWSAVNGVVNTSGAVGNIVVPTNALVTPSATSQFTLNANLNASAVVGDPTGTFSSPIQVVDSLGSTHTLTVTYTKTAANAWSYNITIPGEDLASGKAGTPSSVAKGNLTFNSQGQLTAPAPPNPVAVAITGLADGATDLNVNWNLYTNGAANLTQYASASALSASTQDGIAAAQLTRVGLDTNGQVLAHYSDGSSRVVAQVALAGISNPDTLVSVGNNNFQVSASTATPVVGAAGTGPRGTIQGGALESSTVDIAQEFTNLIVYQRAYQANSRVISTTDQILQDLISLIR